MLRLYYRYRIYREESVKYSIRREGPFRIKKVISKLAYELELLANIKIYLVVSVA